MKTLIVKTSSLGDVLHTLPALSDAMTALPGIRFDWVVEESFAEIPAWHPAVDKVIPVALRRWRRQPLPAFSRGEYGKFLHSLRAHEYAKIIDAQGLIKSALLTRLARGERHGLDRSSAREPWAAWAYQKSYNISRQQHAIARVRQLFAAALGYDAPATPPDYKIRRELLSHPRALSHPYIVLLHGASWSSKQWPELYWAELAQLANNTGLHVYMPWGNAAERERAERIAGTARHATVLAALNLSELAGMLSNAQAIVGVDSGLAHLAAALATPSVTLYGATSPEKTGTLGRGQQHIRADFICSPCMARVCSYRGESDVTPACYQTTPPAQVWQALMKLLGNTPLVNNN